MRHIRAFIVVVTAALAALAAAAPASAQQPSEPPRRVGILWLDGTTLQDWRAPGLASFDRLFDEGAVALLSNRTEEDATDMRAMRAAAAATVAAGERLDAGVAVSVLGDAFEGARVSVLGDADTAAFEDRATRVLFGVEPDPLSRPDEVFPGGRVVDLRAMLDAVPDSAETSDVVLVDFGDGARVQHALGDEPADAAQWMSAVMQRADRVLEVMLADGRFSTVFVVSPTSPVERRASGIRLSVVGILDRGVPGLLRSGTTRRAGLVTLADLTPAIASAAGKAVSVAEGRAITVESASGTAATLQELEDAVTHSALVRRALTRWMLRIGMVAAGLAALALLARRRPRWVREVLIVLLLATAAAPLALYVEGVFEVRSRVASLMVAGYLSLALGGVARVALGVRRGLAAVCALTAAVIVVDVALGAPLGYRSPLSFQIAGGGRFYGVDDGVLGVVVGAALFAAALLLDKQADRARIGFVAVGLAAAVWVMSAPALGAKFGAPLTALPVFGVLAARMGGRRLGLASVAVIAAATLAITASFVAIDAAGDTEAQSHVARAVGGRGDIASLIERKVRSTWNISTRTIWPVAVLVFGSVLLLLRLRRRALFERLGPVHRTALLGSLVGVLAGVAFNDGGVITAAPIALYAAAATLPVMLAIEPDDSGDAQPRATARAQA